MEPLCVQIPLLDRNETAAMRTVLSELADQTFFHEPKYHRRGLVKQMPADYNHELHWDSWFPVEFDEVGRVLRERVTEVYRGYKGYETIRTVAIKALEAMAAQLQWKSCTQPMGITVMQHVHLEEGGHAGPIEWHYDTGEHSLVILLDDQTGWTGGEFLFRDMEHPLVNRTFEPQEGKGILFTNKGTEHSVTRFTATADNTNRSIFTVHQNPEKAAAIHW